VAEVTRILVALEPRMYREVLAFNFRQERPLSEVTLASSRTLKAEAQRTKPHLIIATEIPSELKEKGAFFWVEIRIAEGLVASVHANGQSTTIEDVSLQELLAVLDQAQEGLLAHDDEA
jgi:hypothetical protein